MKQTRCSEGVLFDRNITFQCCFAMADLQDRPGNLSIAISSRTRSIMVIGGMMGLGQKINK